MDDDLEDKIFYQTYVSHAKLLSRFASPANAAVSATMAAVLRFCRNSVLPRADIDWAFILLIGILLLSLWTTWALITQVIKDDVPREPDSLMRQKPRSEPRIIYHHAVQGRRDKMEDR